MNIYQKLANIQAKLKVEKNKHNEFGGFDYRSCEDILQAIKPFLQEQKCAIKLDDDLIAINDKVYIKATARLIDIEDKEEVAASAFAQEPPKPKAKMDESQTTGSTSSYARKYALGGLFALDDGNDSDKTNNGKNKEKPEEKLITKAQIAEMKKLGFTEERLNGMAKYYKVEKPDQVTFKQAEQAIQKQKKANAKAEEGSNGQSKV